MKLSKRLKIWILKDGETLPVSTSSKKMRTWRLGEALIKRGHSVTWWASNFSHREKKKVCDGDTTFNLDEHFKVRLIDCGAYQKNLSLARIKHHRNLGEKFFSLAQQEEKPDIIIASFPPIELFVKAIEYGNLNNIPVIVDIRDMWPDIFSSYFPNIFKPFFSFPLYLYSRKLNPSLRQAQAIVSMSEDCLHWALKRASIKKSDNNCVFYIGYDESSGQERERIRALDQIPQDKVIFSYLGTFTKTNHVEFIVDSLKELEKDEEFNGYFIIAGDGEKRDALQQKSRDIKNILLLNWLNKGQSSYLMEKTDVSLVSISLGNNLFFPNKIFESLFFGKPIISSIEGEAKKLLEKHKAGVYYKAGDRESFITAVKSLLNESKRKEMSQNSRHLYDTSLRSDKIYQNYCSFIESTYDTYNTKNKFKVKTA